MKLYKRIWLCRSNLIGFGYYLLGASVLVSVEVFGRYIYT